MRFLMKKVMDGVDLAQFPQWTDGRRVIWTLGNSRAAGRGEQLLLKYMAAGTVTLLTSSHSPRKSLSSPLLQIMRNRLHFADEGHLKTRRSINKAILVLRVIGNRKINYISFV
jgi:hypothetical protein